ncbi:MAG: leucine-rich repeat domain-containing protein [Ruminococcus sp.]
MAAIAEYLTALDSWRDQLAANLTAMGVTASASEKLNTLVPKVLEIPQSGAKDGTAVFSRTVDKIDAQAFLCAYCLTEVYIPDNITQIGNYAFQYCDTITRLHIPASVTTMGSLVFQYCTRLEHVTVGEGFACNLDIGASTAYTADTLNGIIANLGTGSYTLTIGSTNLAKLTDAEKAVATNKGWTLA